MSDVRSDKYEIVGKSICLHYRNGYGYWIASVASPRDALTDCHPTPEDAFSELGPLVTHCGPIRRRRIADQPRDDL